MSAAGSGSRPSRAAGRAARRTAPARPATTAGAVAATDARAGSRGTATSTAAPTASCRWPMTSTSSLRRPDQRAGAGGLRVPTGSPRRRPGPAARASGPPSSSWPGRFSIASTPPLSRHWHREFPRHWVATRGDVSFTAMRLGRGITVVTASGSSSTTLPRISTGVSRGISRWLKTTSRGKSARVRSLRRPRAPGVVMMTGG